MTTETRQHDPTPTPGPLLASPNHEMEEVRLQDYLNVLYRRRKSFSIAAGALFIGVVIFTFTMKPVYEASATLHVKDEKGKTEVIDVLGANSVNPVDSEVEILKSRTNAENVVKQLHLDWRVAKRSEGVTFQLLDFASTAKEPSFTVNLLGNGAYEVMDADGNRAGKGESGRLMRGKDVSLLLNDLRGAKGDSFRLDLLPFNATVDGLRKNVKAAEVGKNTNIIAVTYRNTDPALARDVANTLVRVYLEQSVGFRAEEASHTVAFVQDQLQGLRTDLDNAEKNLASYKSASGVVMLDQTASDLIDKISTTETDRAAVTLQKKQVEFAVAALKDAARRGVTYSPAGIKDDPLVADMASRLAVLEVQKQALLADSTEEHPAVKAVRAQIDEVQRKIQATYESELRSLTKGEADIKTEMSGYEGLLKGLPAAERDLARLTRVSKVNADIYSFLLQKHEEARIAKASTISNISIVDPAITPDQPIKPQKGKNLLLGLLVGCMLGVGLAFFQEYLDDTIKESDSAKRVLGWPLLAVTPHISRIEAGEQGRNISLLTHLEPKSQAAEAFRTLRTGIHFSSVNRRRQVIVLTSTFPGEGKSTISSNLSCIFSQTGAGVILIDCDLRRSTLHDCFGCARDPGLSNHLAGDIDMERIIHRTEIEGLDFTSAGVIPPNPAELLGSGQMKELIELLRGKYDTIIIDAPPVLAVTDAQLLTSLADMVIVVIEAGRVPVKAALQMREMLESVNAPVAGMILNDKSGKGQEHYGYSYYGGKYHGYYGYGYGYYSEKQEEPKKWWGRFLKKLPFKVLRSRFNVKDRNR